MGQYCRQIKTYTCHRRLSLPVYDLFFFKRLAGLIPTELVLLRDKALGGMLSAIEMGIEKPFAPDERTGAMLKIAIDDAKAILENRFERLAEWLTGFRPPTGISLFWCHFTARRDYEKRQIMEDVGRRLNKCDYYDYVNAIASLYRLFETVAIYRQ